MFGAQLFPKDYTSIAIRPLMKSKKETFHLCSRENVKAFVKLSIMKDGRAAITTGWRDLAPASNISHGANVTFTFNKNKDNAIDVKVDALTLCSESE